MIAFVGMVYSQEETPAAAPADAVAAADTATPEPTNWEKYWKLTGIIGLNVTQTSFTN